MGTTYINIFYLLSISSKKRKIYELFISSILVLLLELIGFGLIFPVFKVSIDAKFAKKLYQIIEPFNFISFSLQSLPNILAFSFLFFFLLKTLLTYRLIKYQSNIISDIILSLTEEVLNSFKNTPYIDYIKINVSQIIKLSHIDVYHFGEIIRSFLYIITEISVLISVIFVSFYINFLYTILFLFYLFFVSFCYFRLNKKRISTLGYDRNLFLTEKNNFLYQFIQGFKEVLIFKNSDFYISRINKANVNYEFANNKILINGQIPKLILEIVFLIPIVIFIIYFNSFGYTNFINLIPVFSFLIFAIIRVIPSFNKIVVSIQNIHSFSPSLNNLHNYISTNKINYNSELNHYNKITHFEKLFFKRINFSYPTSTKQLFKNINIEINKGDKILLFGPSGVGKSTLLDILVGLIRADVELIELNSKKCDFESYSNISNLFTYVPQNVYIFRGTIIENILMNNKMDHEKFNSIARLVDLFSIVPENQSMHEYQLMEKGLNLSGGQKQRIGLARALYWEHEILVLDESTNSLDSKSEENIINELLNKEELTLIAISHNTEVKNLFNRVIELS